METFQWTNVHGKCVRNIMTRAAPRYNSTVFFKNIAQVFGGWIRVMLGYCLVIMFALQTLRDV